MSSSKKLSNQPFPWFWMGMASVFLLSSTLRFWGLSRFNTLVFDEVYYAKFANNYLTHTQFFDGHPPLSKYIIALGMWIGNYLPFGQDAVNSLTGSLHSTWSYRWLNALTGSFIPLVVGGIAYQLSHRRSYAFIAALFAATDGLFLVESRYALNNVYLVIFGLLGQWFLLLGLERRNKRRWFWLALAGIGFGASVAIKWNGLWFLLGAYFIWIAAWVIRWVQSLENSYQVAVEREDGQGDRGSRGQGDRVRIYSPLQNLTQLKIWHVLVYLAIIPVLVYSLSWIPHLQLNPQPDFLGVQKQILDYHQRIGSGSDVHPYCSAWDTWLWMLRPVAYFYGTTQTLTEPLPVLGPPLPRGAGKVIYDVHAMGNPALWWLSTVAILFLLSLVAQKIWLWATRFQPSTTVTRGGSFPTDDNWIVLYLVCNWLANLLPWVRVTRCTFLYHYMGASVFAGLAIALIVDYCLHTYRPQLQPLGITAIFLILLAFVFWMPIYLGLPLSLEEYMMRMPRFDVKLLPPWLTQWLPNWL